MRIGRREFLKYCIGSAAALGLPLSTLGKLEKVLAADGLPTVVWLNGANCTGCTVSLANLFSRQAPTDIADLLVNTIDLAFHPNLMGAAGDLAVATLNQATQGDFILAVDGGIPTAFGGAACMVWTENGHEVTAMEAVSTLAPKAMAVLSIGSCASFGGIPAGNPNPTGIKSVRDVAGTSTINIPGCPTHPDWIVWTVAQLLAGTTVPLDSFGRPTALFGGENLNVHKRCPREDSEEAHYFGEEGRCLKELGCKGPRTQADCPARKWNSGTNWCIGANAICLGCTESGFPDKFSPFYKVEYSYSEYKKPETTDTTAPSIMMFAIPSTATALSVAITSLSATDNVAVTGYLLTETETKPLPHVGSWSSAKPANYTFEAAGTRTLYAWAKDAAGNVSASRSAKVTITLPSQSDKTAPVVTAFSIPSKSTSLTVAISTFTASDNVGVTGYLLTETSTKPSASAAGWTSSKPANHTFASAGTRTLYAWAKDAAGNVSASRSAKVTITSSSGSADISASNSLDFGSVEVKESEKKTLKVTNKGTAKMTVSKVEVVGTNASAFKPSVTAFNVEPSKTYELKIEFKPAAKSSYSATLKIHSNDPDTPVKGITLIGKGVDDD